MKILFTEARAATGGLELCAERFPSRFSVSTDTRSLGAGDTFVALRGERFDGHDYVTEALERGAGALVVADARCVPPGVPALVVGDTTNAYLALGAVARRRSRARFAGITGSAGKTTTKAFLATILERTVPGPVVATPANENNQIGVAKLLLGLPENATFVVVEFGARHFGEIEPLARAAAPELAVITNIGEAHLEIMGSLERLIETKWGIFTTGARPVLNAADPVLRARAKRAGADRMWFASGRQAPDGASETGRTTWLEGRERLHLSAPGEPVRSFATRLEVPGDHNLANVAAAAAAAIEFGVEPAAVAAALPHLALPRGRYERHRVGEFDVIYDAYNASMSGTIATLSSFAREAAARRIAVLGSMAELGADAAAMHARVGAAAANGHVDVLLVGGDFALDLERGARDGGLAPARIVPFATNADALVWLRGNVRPGDLVLLKASRRYKLEEVLEGLQAEYA